MVVAGYPVRRVLIPVANGCCEVHVASLKFCFAVCGAEVVTACIDGDDDRMIKAKLIKVRYEQHNLDKNNLMLTVIAMHGNYSVRSCAASTNILISLLMIL
jgi:hypothetical protein